MERLKSRMGHLRIQKILRKKRGNHCETAVLKEETWTHQQKKNWINIRKYDSKRNVDE